MADPKDREHILVTTPAYKHLQRIKAQRKKLGLSYSITGYVSDLILSQPLPVNGNGKAHIVGQDEPVVVKVKASEIELNIEGEVKS